ncbi:MAG: pyocin knob domain-containing protein [Bacteroides sp.]|nr:pyocin knob domain-containing protein [Bacteroides sp.]
MGKKKLNEVQAVNSLKDSEYILVTMEDGSVGRIRKSELYPAATENMAGLIKLNDVAVVQYKSEVDIDDLIIAGIYRLGNHTKSNTPDTNGYGNAIVLRGGSTDTMAQIYISFADSSMYVRSQALGNGKFTTRWKKVKFED